MLWISENRRRVLAGLLVTVCLLVIGFAVGHATRSGTQVARAAEQVKTVVQTRTVTTVAAHSPAKPSSHAHPTKPTSSHKASAKRSTSHKRRPKKSTSHKASAKRSSSHKARTKSAARHAKASKKKAAGHRGHAHK